MANELKEISNTICFEQSHNLWDLQFTLYNLRSCKKILEKLMYTDGNYVNIL